LQTPNFSRCVTKCVTISLTIVCHSLPVEVNEHLRNLACGRGIFRCSGCAREAPRIVMPTLKIWAQCVVKSEFAPECEPVRRRSPRTSCLFVPSCRRSRAPQSRANRSLTFAIFAYHAGSAVNSTVRPQRSHSTRSERDPPLKRGLDAPIQALKAAAANRSAAAKTQHQTGYRLQHVRRGNDEAVLGKVTVEGKGLHVGAP